MRSTLALSVVLALPCAAPRAQGPNVLMIISDDLNMSLGCYGDTVTETPNLDRLARDGVRYTRAYCQSPVCGPSRASFMSGLYPHATRMLRISEKTGSYRTTNPALAEHPSIGGLLRRHGYVSLRVSKVFHMGVPGGVESGAPGGDDPDSWDRAFNIMGPETASPGTLELLSPKNRSYGSAFTRVVVPDELIETQTDHLAVGHAIALLENRARGRTDSRFLRPEQPFFLAVGLLRPHVPLIAPERLFDRYPEDEVELPEVPRGDLDDVPPAAATMENSRRYGMSELQQRQVVAAYRAAVTDMDEQVGRLLDAVDRLGLRDDTVVIFFSDHGYSLGEHGCWQKVSLFEESARVPLIVRAPGMAASAGAACDALVELIDLYPTIAELAGLAAEAPSNLQGTSLVPLLGDPAQPAVRQVAYTVNSKGGESIRTERWRYNVWPEGGEELYDHQTDPGEFTNLARFPSHLKTLGQMRKLYAETRKRSEL